MPATSAADGSLALERPPRGEVHLAMARHMKTGVVLGEPACALEKEEGETAFGLDREKVFSP